jgi:hypothetical protein
MKWNLFDTNASFMEFYYLEIVYTRFYIDETSSRSVFISKKVYISIQKVLFLTLDIMFDRSSFL